MKVQLGISPLTRLFYQVVLLLSTIEMKMARCRTMSHLIKKCVMEKEIYIVDLEPFIKLQSSLGIANNNINQIARRVNKTGVIYKTDIKEIKSDIAKISKEQWDIHSLLLKRTRELNK